MFVFKRMCSSQKHLSFRVQGAVQTSCGTVALVPSPIEAGVAGSVNNSLARSASQNGHHSAVQIEAGLWKSSRTKTEEGKERRSLKRRK